ncbi:F0F1 ATP synthase subunit epsilon [Sinimarinibacterium sp. CAU 1509]|uniref:F0F1 ATP synthase subunit epsilon n=1 Tax=Sinimarinibacterium sp. CAU 1509 TaxID=2562283 RepID=UPI0010AC3CA1|nr:F0F1 ATP synthase subunit epsilon [Sinimarinibacterium sp. CAU 1509]TJY63099.1 F0F1 ATP synthase subunit epsilon [Sinimarinibacterium sp. CAU 1509]
MRLRLTSLGEVLIDAEVKSVRAEDGSGAFGILPRHVDFLTALSVGVLTWHDTDNTAHHCAVRGGVLTVNDGDVAVATREGVVDDDLNHLESTVLASFRSRDEEEQKARLGGHQLGLRVAREILRYLNPGRGGLP